MRNPIEIENIEEMRLQEGIDDVELRKEIRGLRVGNFVRLTFMNGANSCETLLVRITSIRGYTFRGKLVDMPASPSLSQLRVGVVIVFTTAHIHSVPKGGPAHGQ